MPTDNPQKALAQFLESATPPEADVVVISSEPIPPPPVSVLPPAPVDIIEPTSAASARVLVFAVLADLKRIGMTAKNLHYRAYGTPFYGLHLLADLVYDVAHETDDLIETYYMGELKEDPPTMEDICRTATDLTVVMPEAKNPYIVGLKNICHKTIKDIEELKKEFGSVLPAGVHAVLDSISQKCLISLGLLVKTEE